MTFQENGLPGDRVDPRVDDRERRRRAKNVVAIVYHTVRMSVRLSEEGFLGLFLLVMSCVSFVTDARGCQHAGDRDNQADRDQRNERDPGA